eukprot:TRINITY_DN1265_c0_g1_i1.p1 TRINITY_DN1265_c0_g1~~TRINITY_DN1265_c0_g1_i1.p1  ORF type:complete len:273 (+),score=91.82 TRINITY_DN1265_c0_g1_i1:35-820(+)
MVYHEYQVIGRKIPTEKEPNPKIYRMKIFAKNPVLARSRFWHFLSLTRKVKRATGEILGCNEIFETSPSQGKRTRRPKNYHKKELIKMVYHEYQVIGRKIPTEKEPNPKIYRMKIFAKNPVLARSRFWHFLSLTRKVKRATGEILGCNEIFETSPRVVKNFGAFLRYDSHTGTHNIYKEYRDVSRTGAITQLYSDMAGQYGADARDIQVISLDSVPGNKSRRPQTKQFLNSKIKFPLPHRIIKKERKFKNIYRGSRPVTHF